MRAILASLLLLLPLPALADALEATIYTRSGEVRMSLELATTQAAREKGLMGRTELKPHDGMLFLFPEDGDHGFWMRNTPLSLDMLFIDAGKTIRHIAAGVEPYSTRLQRAGRPIRAVIELDAGRAARDGIAVGDKVRYVLPETVTVD